MSDDDDNYANGIKKITPELIESGGDKIPLGKGFSLDFSVTNDGENEMSEYHANLIQGDDKVDGRDISAKELQDYYFGNKLKMKVEMATSLVVSNSIAIFDASDDDNENDVVEK